MTAWPKRCGCCAREYTEEEWEELDLVGLQDLGGVLLELRNCADGECKSTLAIPVGDTSDEAA